MGLPTSAPNRIGAVLPRVAGGRVKRAVRGCQSPDLGNRRAASPFVARHSIQFCPVGRNNTRYNVAATGVEARALPFTQ